MNKDRYHSALQIFLMTVPIRSSQQSGKEIWVQTTGRHQTCQTFLQRHKQAWVTHPGNIFPGFSYFLLGICPGFSQSMLPSSQCQIYLGFSFPSFTWFVYAILIRFVKFLPSVFLWVHARYNSLSTRNPSLWKQVFAYAISVANHSFPLSLSPMTFKRKEEWREQYLHQHLWFFFFLFKAPQSTCWTL